MSFFYKATYFYASVSYRPLISSPPSLEVILNLEIYSDFSVKRHFEGGEGDGWASKMTEEGRNKGGRGMEEEGRRTDATPTQAKAIDTKISSNAEDRT